MLTPVNPLLLPLDPPVEPLQTNRRNNHHLPDTANLMSNMVFEQPTYFSDSQKVTVLSHTDTHRTGTLRLELFPNVSYRLFY